ncbi:hypothetical protein ABL975_17270 [Pseudomonas aeruginosa]|uniref:Uncharacterized protein n=1 Tax=Pseudomonas phage Epa33 TaxID=2719194 RepID=A0A6G9LMF5_9CAUD|nr:MULTISPECIES: hypothetical protein [Pseudomonas aeruginosa group]YP_010765965.1 hypothetical protein QGM59_gp11 [Pseudomonas phage Epa33]KAA5617969.1 hypothetical protein F3H15_19685 [Pseudomonas aeruginosa]KAA5641896.1 hypothetical protein F3H16_12360 [Pseudomonas aeruginosa]KAA5662148.1 hypothetical protein F3G64_33205 [Pseudomonas aeruginosa]MBG5510625.1 hypothetical protein [Pseudomonas aeruginosa]MBG7406433.1 hypothetical protein [Pseudomonas aeruginosa]
MIHYHGTPIGGTRQDAARFLAGRHALVPFPRQDDVAIVAEVCQSFCFDNGAFSVWKKGGTLDVESYLRWVDDWRRHPGFDWALIPDVIDGDEADNDRLLEQWPEHLPGVPVWHLHESLERLQRLASAWRTVALGSSGQWATPGTAPWWKRISAAMNSICDARGRPTCRLHGLRMLDPKIFGRLPFASADSTNAAVNGGSVSRFGIYPPPTAGQRAAVIADRIETHNSAPVWTHSGQAELSL